MKEKKTKKKIPTKQLIRRLGLVMVILGAVMVLLGCLFALLALIIVGAVFLVQGFIMLCVNQDMEDRGYFAESEGEKNAPDFENPIDHQEI